MRRELRARRAEDECDSSASTQISVPLYRVGTATEGDDEWGRSGGSERPEGEIVLATYIWFGAGQRLGMTSASHLFLHDFRGFLPTALGTTNPDSEREEEPL